MKRCSTQGHAVTVLSRLVPSFFRVNCGSRVEITSPTWRSGARQLGCRETVLSEVACEEPKWFLEIFVFSCFWCLFSFLLTVVGFLVGWVGDAWGGVRRAQEF